MTQDEIASYLCQELKQLGRAEVLEPRAEDEEEYEGAYSHMLEAEAEDLVPRLARRHSAPDGEPSAVSLSSSLGLRARGETLGGSCRSHANPKGLCSS